MSKLSVGRGLIILAALMTVVVPFVVDVIFQAGLHMQNPAWLPHAKLHTAMSVHAAIALGVASVALLAARWRRPERADMAIAAFLATSFWAGLILARLWPGTAYSILNNPASAEPPLTLLGLPIEGNVIQSVVTIAIGWAGFALAASGVGRDRPGADRRREREESPVEAGTRG